MIKEAYCSYEISKLLKEKGFDEDTICNYADVGGITEKWYDDYRERVLRFDWDEGYLIEPPTEPKDQYEIIGDTISAPTHQMTMAWLREVYNIDIIIFHEKLQNDCYWARIERNLFTEFELELEYDSYEEAVEAAIKYCLENLI